MAKNVPVIVNIVNVIKFYYKTKGDMTVWQTTNSFQVRGKVIGVKSKRFYTNGNGKNGGSWNVTEFGVEIEDRKSVYVKLNGYTRDSVFYYKKGEGGAKGTTQKVAWKDRNKAPGKDYRLIGVNISTGKDENGKNINNTFTEYDAVEWIHENLHDGDSVFVKGTINFSSYVDKNGESHKKIDLVPTQISYTNDPVDFDAEDYSPMAEFENTLVFSDISKEEDENSKPTGRFILSGYSIGYNSVEGTSFIIDSDHAKLANNLRKAMKPGYAIKTYGRVDVINDISVVNNDDSDGWGESSPMERINSPVHREYVVYRADPSTIDKDEYSEDAIANAIRKINAAKAASEKFGDKPKSNIDIEVDDDVDWGGSTSTDDDLPWG